MKIITVIGARPQFIKAAAVSKVIATYNETKISKHAQLDEVIIHTGQHYDRNMSHVFFEEMDIPKPDYFLNINGLSHGAMTGQMLKDIETILQKEKPDMGMVYGDTNSTLAGALSAAKLNIPVTHIEAGVRSYNRHMPEEINRILTDHISSILFCPTEQAIENLKHEGIIKNKTQTSNYGFCPEAYLVGDVMLDAALLCKQWAKKPNFDLPSKFILVTIHRPENTDNIDRLKSIFDVLNEINQEIPIVLPLHPRTQKQIDKHQLLSKISTLSATIIKPVSYFEMIYLILNCNLVMTDSGGLQKEAYFFGKPCVTLRDETEWVELLDMGVNKLVGADREKIYDNYLKMKEKKIQIDFSLYGDGKAGERIVNRLVSF